MQFSVIELLLASITLLLTVYSIFSHKRLSAFVEFNSNTGRVAFAKAMATEGGEYYVGN